MRDHYEKIIESTGEDIRRPGLLDTPDRAAKAFSYLTSGYEMDLKDVINDALFPSDSEEMVIVKDIELFSLCEHHLLPFIGKCHVAYIPNGSGAENAAKLTLAAKQNATKDKRLNPLSPNGLRN